MKEIAILMRELRGYPSNFFVEAQENSEENKPGLVVYQLVQVQPTSTEFTRKEVGFIEL